MENHIDLFVISTRNGNHFGQFIFPKLVLYKHSIISDSEKEGKRAIRVYPPSDIPMNGQAQKNQKWQLEYFLEISDKKVLDIERIKTLYSSQ